MKQLDQYDVTPVSRGVDQSNSPSLTGIGMPVDSLPMPICPVAVPPETF
ncbi:MAG: hypothetical protein ACR2GP_05685 [Burkholderiaceae bacterium]